MYLDKSENKNSNTQTALFSSLDGMRNSVFKRYFNYYLHDNYSIK